MGWIRDSKAELVRKEAAKARAEGHVVFTLMLNMPMVRPDFSGEVVDWSLMIEAAESEGWFLVHFAGVSDKRGRPEALCVFRPHR